MDKADIPFTSASQLSALIKKREVSPVEAVEAYLDRIDGLNGTLHAYLTVCRDEMSNLSGAWTGLPTHTCPSLFHRKYNPGQNIYHPPI